MNNDKNSQSPIVLFKPRYVTQYIASSIFAVCLTGCAMSTEQYWKEVGDDFKEAAKNLTTVKVDSKNSKTPDSQITQSDKTDFSRLTNENFLYHFAARTPSPEKYFPKIADIYFPEIKSAKNEFERKRMYDSIRPVIESNVTLARITEAMHVDISWGPALPPYNFDGQYFEIHLPTTSNLGGWFTIHFPEKIVRLQMTPDKAEKLRAESGKSLRTQMDYILGPHNFNDSYPTFSGTPLKVRLLTQNGEAVLEQDF